MRSRSRLPVWKIGYFGLMGGLGAVALLLAAIEVILWATHASFVP